MLNKGLKQAMVLVLNMQYTFSYLGIVEEILHLAIYVLFIKI